ALQQSQYESPDHAQVRWGMIPPYPAFVLTEADIELPMEIVLDPPVPPGRLRELLGRQHAAQDVIARLQAVMAQAVDPLRGRDPDGLQVSPLALRIDRTRGRHDRVGPRLLTAMPLLGGHVLLEAARLLLRGEVDRRLDPRIQGRLVLLDRQ